MAPEVQIPYVTSYEGYTQRIVIVNRNKVDVDFSLEFRAEGDGMIDGDEPVRRYGERQAQATVLKVDELVTLTSPSRASATLTVAAKQGTIDVATTQGQQDGPVDRHGGSPSSVQLEPQASAGAEGSERRA